MDNLSTKLPPSTVMDLFAERVSEIMQENGWTVAEVARKAGISRPGLSNLLHGKGGNCSLATAEGIAEAVGVPLYKLIRP